ncbi:glycerophosphodiester phosphodiesterase [Paenibacillus aceris]|uniref:Glycerophosphoryl diester phosphodiesterase n=1 Tax=Paenibacillus aceris TaxID=869555 RepID=A0ABS4I8Y5_9BACL|nr:glycerophosphodiester phosphodiesterase [Paenibacillus aceris]MBP1967384.1 glycerophosphoryl diester phosphodiesterase [Paenibacillus aceris]NHW39260.1 glycerophosphodiester phosphodiesterase [Paenibacillus aceris]
MNTHQPIVIGHRGAAGEAPENTLRSFALAFEQGADGIELDVHITKDGEIVVCHDATLDRTTNGSGLICEKSWEEVKELDAGFWFSDAFVGERVPLLREVFELVPRGLFINVEVKHAYEGRMEKALLAFLRESGRIEDVVISSFDHKVIHRIKQAEPEVRVGLLYSADLYNHAAYAQQIGVEVHSLHPSHHHFEKEDAVAASAAGLATYPYTANDVRDYQKLIDAGVTGIITDFPARLRKVLGA